MKKLILIAALVLSSCGKQAVIQHPGAVNAFDSNTYDALITVGASVLQAKELVTDSFPQYKDQFNKVNQAYRALEDSYRAYHIALTQGLSPDSNALAIQLTKVTTDITTLLTSLGVKK